MAIKLANQTLFLNSLLGIADNPKSRK